MNALETEFITICQTALKEEWLPSMTIGQPVLDAAGGTRFTLTNVTPGRRVWPEKAAAYWRFDRAVLVELISRTVAVRARHYEDALGEAWQPNDWQDRIRREHPTMDSVFDFNGGWADMLTAAAEWGNEVGDPLHIDYAKEKFGDMSLFGGCHDDKIADLGGHVEYLSGFICEDCGAPGRNRADRGWWRTQCDKHHEERSRR